MIKVRCTTCLKTVPTQLSALPTTVQRAVQRTSRPLASIELKMPCLECLGVPKPKLTLHLPVHCCQCGSRGLLHVTVSPDTLDKAALDLIKSTAVCPDCQALDKGGAAQN